MPGDTSLNIRNRELLHLLLSILQSAVNMPFCIRRYSSTYLLNHDSISIDEELI